MWPPPPGIYSLRYPAPPPLSSPNLPDDYLFSDSLKKKEIDSWPTLHYRYFYSHGELYLPYSSNNYIGGGLEGGL